MNEYDFAVNGPWIRNSRTDTEYKIEVDKYVRVAFKGSTSKMDWRQNFKFWKAPYKNMMDKWYAHAGFVEKWKSIEDQVMAELVKTEGPIRVYGFSQGGAIAVLAHECIRYHMPDRLIVTKTWGAPRVVAFGGRIKSRFEGIVQIQHKGDIIPHLPPWLFGYSHVGVQEKVGNFSFNFKQNHMSYSDD